MNDTFRTIEKPSQESFFKEKGSKFFGYAFPLLRKEDVKSHIENLKKQHPTAGHFCYAWKLGQEAFNFRVSDDGEPKNTAGMSIYGQILSFDLTNILVVSVRYFGGTKLGVGGLKQAYKYSAQITLEGSILVEKTIDVLFQLTFDYAMMNKVMRIVKEENIRIINQKSEMDCVYTIAVRKGDKDKVMRRINDLYNVKIEKVE